MATCHLPPQPSGGSSSGCGRRVSLLVLGLIGDFGTVPSGNQCDVSRVDEELDTAGGGLVYSVFLKVFYLRSNIESFEADRPIRPLRIIGLFEEDFCAEGDAGVGERRAVEIQAFGWRR